MTDEEAIEYVKYAKIAYQYHPYRRKACGGDIADFIQDFVLLGLEYPDMPKGFLLSKLLLNWRVRDWQKPVEYALQLLALPLDEDDEKIDFVKELSCEDEIEDEADDYLLSQILEVLYPNKIEKQESTLDYLYGSTFGYAKRGLVQNIRKKLFNYRFIILRLMHDSGYLSDSDYDYYNTLAEAIDKPIRRALKNTPEAKCERDLWRAKHKKESHT